MKIIFISCLYCICLLNAKSTPIEIKIDPKDMPEGDLRMSDLIESIEYIPLETTDESILDDNLVYDLNDNHIVAGYYNGKAVCLFNHKGKFVRTIGQKGAGPEEYLYISQLFIDPNNHYIIVIDGLKKIYYNMEGKFLYSSPLSVDNRDRKNELFFREQFLRVAESYIFRDSTYYVYDIYNQTGNLVKEAIPSVPISLKKDSQWRLSYKCKEINPVYIYQNQLHVREYLNDTVYTINGLNQFIPKYVLNLGKYKITPEIQADIKNFENHINNKVVITEIAETSNKLLMHYFYKWKFHSCYYDKKERKVYKFASDGFPNDYDGGIDFLNMYPIYGQKNNYIRTSFQAGEFIDKGEKCLSKKRPAKGPKSAVNRFKDLVMKKVDAEDNPVLMIVKLKD